MFAVNIALGNTVWRLLFKEEKTAKLAFNHIHDKGMYPQTIFDDFGQMFTSSFDKLNGVMFEDLDQSKLANIELFLHQQRVQVAAQKAAQSDPGLRASAAMGGPSVLTPFRQNN